MGGLCGKRAAGGNPPDVAAEPTAPLLKPRGAEAKPAVKKTSKEQQGHASKSTSTGPKQAAPIRIIDGKTAEEWKSLGSEGVKNGDHAAAYEAYSQGLKADPDHAMILSNRALCLEKLGRLEEAVTDAKRCMTLRPDFVKAFLRAATILRELKRPEEALDVLRRAPTNSEVEQLLGKVKPEAAKVEKSRLSKLGNAERLKEEGNVLFKKGSFEQALAVYTKALEACKDQNGELAVAIRNNRAGCYQQLSDFHSVVTETNFVLAHEPENLKALLRRMLAYEPLEKYEEALADARRLIQKAPANEAANKMQHRLSKIVRERGRDVSAAGA